MGHEYRHELLVLRREHPALHSGETPCVGDGSGVSEVGASPIPGTEGGGQQPYYGCRLFDERLVGDLVQALSGPRAILLLADGVVDGDFLV